MIKMIIADDEPHFRRYMQNVITWAKEGFDVCAVLRNGREVQKAIEKYKPEVALLDINMPGMDGLTLAELIREKNRDIKIVFITGYSEFEYARKAIQIGAVEYVLKPFSKDELMSVMKKIKLGIQHQTVTQHQQNIDLQIVREEILKKWIDGTLARGKERFLQDLKRVGIQFNEEYYLVQILEIDAIAAMWNDRETVQLWKFGIKNILDEIMGQANWQQISFCGYEERIVSILNIDLEKYQEKEWMLYYKETQEQIEKCLKITVSVSSGTLEKGAAAVKVSYKNALIALEEKFFRGNGTFIPFAEVTEQNSRVNIYRLELYERFLKGMRKGEFREIESLLEELTEEIHQSHLSANYIYLIFSGMLSICLSYVTEMNGDIEKISGIGNSPYVEMYKMSSLEQCIQFLKNIFKSVIDEYQNTTSKRKNEIIETVYEYIKTHYSDSEMTVESIADSMFLDISYIRRVISEKLGCTISDVISEIRMQEALKLMKETEYPVSLIAEKVGYNEPGYFSRCFKKSYGITPKQFIEKSKSPVFYK